MKNIVSNRNDDPDSKLKEELNRRYEGTEEIEYERELSRVSRRRRLILGGVALALALLFLFTVTARQLYIAFGPSMQFLQESRALADDPLVREVRDSVVQVYVETSAGAPRRQLRGSGFNIHQSGLIVTNRHIVEDAVSVRVSFSGRGTFSAENWTIYQHADLALIFLDAENLPTVDVSPQFLLPGEEVLIIGNPMQYARVANRGEVLGYREMAGSEYPALVIEALVYPGSSGSPVFNDRGAVSGVVYATLKSSERNEILGLAVSSAELQLFLDELNRD